VAFTLTVMASGVAQQAVPLFVIVSHAPPLLVTATASKVILEPVLSPVLAMDKT
jgi:hypothetical protein